MQGPTQAALDLYRLSPSADKIYVEVDIGDGIRRMFLVDTGASVSVITGDLARELGLSVARRQGRLVGLAGTVPWMEAVVPALRIGPYLVRDVAVAVEVPGVPTSAGLVPVAGIIGNNVWGRFEMAVDYPASVLDLAFRGHLVIPDHSTPMFFDGQHARIEARFTARRDDELVEQPLLLEIDTGARGLVVMGASDHGLEALASEGEEPILGVGAGDELPTSNFIRLTRRVSVETVDVGGLHLDKPVTATWIHFQRDGIGLGPTGMPGLLGHAVVKDYRMILDFPGKRFALTSSERPPRILDIHERYLQQLRWRVGRDARLDRAQALVWLAQPQRARRLLQRHLSANADPKAKVMLARLLRHDGEEERALELLTGMSLDELIDEGALVGTVNALWLAGRPADALRLARTATEEHPEKSGPWVALADALRVAGRFRPARHAIRRANQIDENPDGHLLRRAWISSEDGDFYGVLTHVRRLMDLYPSGGVAPWIYAMEVEGRPEEALLRKDLHRTLQRLHPGDGPLDFHAGAWRVVGEDQLAARLMTQGRDRDCPRASSDAGRDNCEAWYRALARTDLDDARVHIDRAIATDPRRAEYLDTLAVVLEAQGEFLAARDAAWRAATLVPDDVYLLWQAVRLDTAVKQAGG